MGSANFAPSPGTELTVIFSHVSQLLFDRKQFSHNPLDLSVDLWKKLRIPLASSRTHSWEQSQISNLKAPDVQELTLNQFLCLLRTIYAIYSMVA